MGSQVMHIPVTKAQSRCVMLLVALRAQMRISTSSSSDRSGPLDPRAWSMFGPPVHPCPSNPRQLAALAHGTLVAQARSNEGPTPPHRAGARTASRVYW